METELAQSAAANPAIVWLLGAIAFINLIKPAWDFIRSFQRNPPTHEVLVKDYATKAELTDLRAELKSDMTQLRRDMGADISQIRTDIRANEVAAEARSVRLHERIDEIFKRLAPKK